MLSAVAGALTVLSATPAIAASPHGEFTTQTDYCLECHSVHDSESSPALAQGTQKALCYTCHDGSGATDVKSQFGETSSTVLASRHPVPEGRLECSSCHTPHEGPPQGNMSSLAVGESRAKAGTAVCGGCHGTGSTLPGGDMVSGFVGSGHADLGVGRSKASIPCAGCHAPHGSQLDALLVSQTRSYSGATITVESANTLCAQCHDSSVGSYPGPEIALATAHSTSLESSRALVQYPDTGQKTQCNGCHDLHGASGDPDYLRAGGDTTCRTCHDDASATYPAGYSYRGAAAYQQSGHASIQSSIRFESTGPLSAGFRAWEAYVQPTVSVPGSAVATAGIEALATVDGTRLRTALQQGAGDDYQTYRFVVDTAAGDIVTATVTWTGLSDATPASTIALFTWNYSAETWVKLAERAAAAQQAIASKVDPIACMNAEGEITVMAVGDRVATDAVSLDVTLRDESPTAGCRVCHAAHGATEGGKTLAEGLIASDERTCMSDGGGACHDSADDSASGVDIRGRLTASASRLAHHDVLSNDESGTAGTVSCSACHNPHVDSAAAPYSDPDDPSRPATSPLAQVISDSGEIYLLAGAAHDGIGPVITNISRIDSGARYLAPIITWFTNEPCTTWIDWGLTTSYELGNEQDGTPFGSHTLATTHITQMSGLQVGSTYHYRVRSTDALGNTSVSPDIVYEVAAPPATPVLDPIADVDGGGASPAAVPVACSTVTSSDGHGVQYQFDVDGILQPWTATPNTTAYLYTGVHQVRVRARDASHTNAVSDWSTPVTFNLTNADEIYGSCPFLFTWDGERYAYEADIHTTGKLASVRATGYEKPNPNDYYVLKHEPAEKDGAPELRLVEERFETDYLDEVSLLALDVPADRDVFAEKIPQGASYQPAEEVLHTVSTQLDSADSATVVSTGEDVTSKIAESDGDYAVLSPDEEQPSYQSIELDLGDLSEAKQIKLIFEGMTRFPSTTEGKALGQAGVRQRLEVLDENGEWVVARDRTLPKPAEFARPYIVDITDVFLTDVYKVRVTFLLKTYVDSIRLDTTEDVPVTIAEVPLESAMLQGHGVDKPSAEGDVYEYVYGEPNERRGYFPGTYTRFGEVAELLAERDDKFVIYGGGDEIVMRFDELPAVPEGKNRRYLLHANGYYKDTNTDVDKTVEPLPFAEMSNYPYPDTEHYPDDTEHAEYQESWNTRVEIERAESAEAEEAAVEAALEQIAAQQAEAAEDGGLIGAAARSLSAAWGRLSGLVAKAGEMIGLESSVVASPSLYSVDSDSVRVTATRSGDTSTTYNVSAGWESSSTPDVKPTPSAPGLAVGEAEIGALVADDGSYWRSASATVDQQWNWQLMRVDLGEDARDTIKELGIVWNGHGEPTPGYPTALYVWNPQAESWMDIRSLDMPTDQDVKYAVNTSGSAFCLTCHDNEPPQGVAALDGVTDIEAEWLDANGDFHGKRTGDGFGTTDVKAPYSRADASGIACVVCHDAHGTESLYHVPTAVNGRQGVVVRSGADFDELCASCHEGQIDQWHAVCVTCHTQGHWVDSMAGVVEGMLPTAASDCSQCHGHGRSWTHPATCLRCHNEIELRIYGVSPDDPWTYTSTF